MNNKGATIESIELLQSLLDNRCGKDSFESRLYKHIKPHINIHSGKNTLLPSHEEEICSALADAFDN
jgi:hypothetical protein